MEVQPMHSNVDVTFTSFTRSKIIWIILIWIVIQKTHPYTWDINVQYNKACNVCIHSSVSLLILIKIQINCLRPPQTSNFYHKIREIFVSRDKNLSCTKVSDEIFLSQETKMRNQTSLIFTTMDRRFLSLATKIACVRCLEIFISSKA